MSMPSTILDFFSGKGYEPHGMCYLWTPGLITLHVLSDALIAIAYYSIPLLLIYFVRKRRDIPFSWIFVMFGIFIVACGTTHVISIYEVWHGAYWMSGWVKASTAIASVGTAIMMVPLLPRALALRSPAELERLNEQLSASLAEKNDLLAKYEREHRVADTLQRASLPRELPNVYGMKFDSYYGAGAAESEVGGDWYDALLLNNDSVVLSVGDVAGRGLHAAVTMGKVRQAMRTMSMETDDPAAILRAGDAAVRLESPGSMATAFVAVYAPSGQSLRYATAGHVPALLREGDSVKELSGKGLPLGFRNSLDNDVRTVSVERGATLVLFTDGLIESRRDFLGGMKRLKEALAAGVAELADPARAIFDAVASGESHDDVAILVAQVLPADNDLNLELEAIPANARIARTALTTFLRDAGVDAAHILAIQIAAGEAVMNAIEHPYGLKPGRFVLEARRRAREVEVNVRDFGRWRVAPRDDRGRGMMMMQKLCSEVALSRSEEGTSVRLTFEVEP